MEENKLLSYVKDVLGNMPSDWLNLTTHRLDIYDEKQAKTQFLEQFELLANKPDSNPDAMKVALRNLPTAYDYIRLGHPLSCILEWAIAQLNHTHAENIISFSSHTIPVMAVLRKNLLDKKNTQIVYTGSLPDGFDAEVLRKVYGYNFDLSRVSGISDVPVYDGSTVFLSSSDVIGEIDLNQHIDFAISTYAGLGSVLLINGEHNEQYISDIQHVRRRETIAMSPVNCLKALKILLDESSAESTKVQSDSDRNSTAAHKEAVLKSIKQITSTQRKALVASSGLSIQYAIMMGLIHDALENQKGKDIKFIVPPNCYGGTNDQARRVAACVTNVEVVDLPVDGDNDMVQSIDHALDKIASENAVPFIIAEIPTNPRVEVPDLMKLREVLSKERKTNTGEKAIDPVFILDQTFCPNVHFLGEDDSLAPVRAISYASGSKFPSGGLCNAGYCVANKKGEGLMDHIEKHLELCQNEATDAQYEVLAKQMPSMNQRISDAYQNTRDFVNFINQTLPEAKINFVSEELASIGFTPSVFSLDLPTKGVTAEEKETYKRKLNHRLINLMITEIPNESKHCVSYGQLKGCYWTIPATSTQGTTKEGDKDYIARVAVSPDLDLKKHKEVFSKFVETL